MRDRQSRSPIGGNIIQPTKILLIIAITAVALLSGCISQPPTSDKEVNFEQVKKTGLDKIWRRSALRIKIGTELAIFLRTGRAARFTMIQRSQPFPQSSGCEYCA